MDFSPALQIFIMQIVTLNLNYYGEKHGPWNVRKKLITDVLRSLEPDVILLQAVARREGEYAGHDQARQLCDELPGFNSHYFKEAQTTDEGEAQGSAVIARLPLLDQSFITLTHSAGHDDPNRRVLLRASFDTPYGRTDIYNGHFSWVHEQAVSNIRKAAAFIRQGNERAIIGGDLNTTPDSDAFMPFLQSGFADAWKKLHGEKDGFTFESDNPTLRIDYFWISQSLVSRLKDVGVVCPPPDSNVRLSDHHGLVISLE